MKITVLRKMRYEKTFIYVMQFGYVFQYLFSWDGGDIYQDHIRMMPAWWRGVLWRLGFLEYPYTKDQIIEGEQIVLSGAMATIDRLTSPEFVEEQRKRNKLAKVTSQAKDCLWQAREAKDGMYYFCLSHGIAVKMHDGEKPSH